MDFSARRRVAAVLAFVAAAWLWLAGPTLAQVGSVFSFVDLVRVAGTALSTGLGDAGTGTPRVVVARDSEICNAKNASHVAVAVSSSGNNELVALTSGQTIYVCDVTLISSGTVAAQLVYGTGTACATGETDMMGPVDLVANTGWTQSYDGRWKTAEANALCLELSAGVAVDGIVSYRKAATF